MVNACPAADPRAVVIGYDHAGRSLHRSLIATAQGLALHGIAWRNPRARDRIASERGCKAYDGIAAVLADPEVDLVVVATPNSTHAECGCDALGTRVV